MDGWAAEKVFGGNPLGFSLDDLVFMPGSPSSEANDVEISSCLTNQIRLRIPLVSGPGSSVTGAEMGTAMAVAGSTGFVHSHQSIDSQVDMVRRIKGHVNGFILDPFVMSPKNTVADLDALKANRGIGSVPITEDGTLRGKLVGWCGARDTDTVQDRKKQLSTVMIRKIVTGQEPISLHEATDLLRKAKVGKLPIVDSESRLVSMVSRSDVKKLRANPRMTRNASNQLVVGAAVMVGMKEAYDRAVALIGAGTDVILVDGSDSAGDVQIDLVQRLKSEFPETDVVAGPVVSCREAKRLAQAGADAILIGSASSPGGVEYNGFSAVGRPEASAIYEVATYVRRNFGIPALAGPGIRSLGHAMKALCLGVSAVLIDDLLSGVDETAGQVQLRGGALMKLHANHNPLQACRERLSTKQSPGYAPQLVTGPVACQGSVKVLLPYLARGIQAGMRDLGLRSIEKLHKSLDDGDLKLECRSPFAARLAEEAANRTIDSMNALR